MIRWGIVSTANIGLKRVVPAIHHSYNGEVVAIASRSLETAEKAAREHNIPDAYGSYEDLLTADNIDAIYNPLPNNLHVWSMKAAEAGIPTLCEKPLAMDAEEATQIVDAFAKHNVLFAEAFMYRFHPRTEHVKQMIMDGAVGKIQTMSASFSFRINNPDNIRMKADLGGGSLMDVGCYCVNVMRHMTGEEPDSVTAQAFWGKEVDINFTGTLHFPSGALGHFDCGFNTAYVQCYDIRGDAGRIFVEDAFVPQLNGPAIIRYWSSDGYNEIALDSADHYQLMVEDFADAILNDREPRFSPQDAINNMRVIDMLKATVR